MLGVPLVERALEVLQRGEGACRIGAPSQHVVERFGHAGVARDRIAMDKDTYVFRSAETTTAEFIDLFRRYYGPTMNAFDAAEKSGKVEDLHAQLLALAEEHNGGREHGVAIPATFLRVTVTR